jgi:hypothetical protein
VFKNNLPDDDNDYKQLAIDWDEFEDEDNDNDNDAIMPTAITEEQLIKKYSDGQLRIVRTTMDFSLHNLNQVFNDENYMDLSPSYQRRNRWDLKKKSLLIESFLMNIPVPPVFVFEKEYNSYEVMDGRQRLQTISEFLDNKFSLRSLEFWGELNGKTFKDLPLILQRGLLRRTITAIVLLAESSKPNESIIDVRMVLFRRLNTGGIKLNNQELRNALYTGTFNDMLLKLSRSDIFTEIWRIPPQTNDEDVNPSEKLLRNPYYKSMTDCELVLRFFAIRETILMNQKGSLRKLLDSCMVRHQKDTMDKIQELEQLFLTTISGLYILFDKKPFTLLTGKLSSPLYDSLMVAYSMIEDRGKVIDEHVQNRLRMALEDQRKYDILTGKGNTIGSIEERVALAKSILLGG